MLFDLIRTLECCHPYFNKHQLSKEDLLIWAEHLGVRIIESRDVVDVCTIINGVPLIFLHDSHVEARSILTLGHKLGHIMLGHLYAPEQYVFSKHNFYKRSRFERSASVIGYLCMIPTPHLIRLTLQGRLAPEELYSDLIYLWGDVDKEFGWKVYQERIRIFQGFLEICGRGCLKGRLCTGCGKGSDCDKLPNFTQIKDSIN